MEQGVICDLDIEYGLNAERLRQILSYDPLTGVFTWRQYRNSNAQAGFVAGCLDAHGYVQISALGRTRKAHRLAYLYMTGKWPVRHIDHINQKKDDNRWNNLRLATDGQNNANRLVRKDSLSGVKGVYWAPKKRKWRSSICYLGRSRHLGYFDSCDRAHEFWCLASDMIRGEFSNHGETHD